RVAGGQRLVDPRPARYHEARTDRVTGAQQGTEIDAVLRPQRRRQQMVPAAVSTPAALRAQLSLGADPHPGHATWGAAPFPSRELMRRVYRRPVPDRRVRGAAAGSAAPAVRRRRGPAPRRRPRPTALSPYPRRRRRRTGPARRPPAPARW